MFLVKLSVKFLVKFCGRWCSCHRKEEQILSERASEVHKGHSQTKERGLNAQESSVTKWNNAPKRGIAQACLLELERKEQLILVNFWRLFILVFC